MANNKMRGIYFKVWEEERNMIKQKIALMGTENMSAYIRKMCIDGYIIDLQIPKLTECAKLLRYMSNNYKNERYLKIAKTHWCLQQDKGDLRAVSDTFAEETVIRPIIETGVCHVTGRKQKTLSEAKAGEGRNDGTAYSEK